jgi:hypothetical protein
MPRVPQRDGARTGRGLVRVIIVLSMIISNQQPETDGKEGK